MEATFLYSLKRKRKVKKKVKVSIAETLFGTSYFPMIRGWALEKITLKSKEREGNLKWGRT